MAEYLTSFIKGRAPLALRAHCISTARENRNKLRQIWHKPYNIRSDDGSYDDKSVPKLSTYNANQPPVPCHIQHVTLHKGVNARAQPDMHVN